MSTTDIDALREFLMEQIDHADSYGGKIWLCAEDARLAMSLLSQLEAANREIAALKSKDISRTLGVGDGSGRLFVHGDYESIKATQKIIIERDALKGEQVPVAYVCTSFLDAKEDFTISKMLPVGTPLYDRPQKPVVPVPVGFLFVVKATGQIIYSTAATNVDGAQLVGPIYGDLAIEAAGGIVKEGE